ncbi:MAG: hypothetical protein ACKV2V_14655 [Blastocatellia bacterium]
MKAARLIKRSEMQEQMAVMQNNGQNNGQNATQKGRTGPLVRQAVTRWVQERQTTRQANPRQAFAALFATAQNGY